MNLRGLPNKVRHSEAGGTGFFAGISLKHNAITNIWTNNPVPPAPLCRALPTATLQRPYSDSRQKPEKTKNEMFFRQMKRQTNEPTNPRNERHQEH